MKTKTSSISRLVAQLEYSPTGISDGAHGELYAAPAYGDLAHGPHGTLIKMLGRIRTSNSHAYRRLLRRCYIRGHGLQEAGRPLLSPCQLAPTFSRRAASGT